MNKFLSKIAALSVGLAMAIGVGVAVGNGSRDVRSVKAATSTYEWAPTTKINSGTTATYNTVEWTLTTGNAQAYQNGYAGLQYGTKSSPSYVTLETTSSFSYSSKTLIKSVTIYANTGGSASVTSFTIGGVSKTLTGSISSNSNCSGNYKNASALTFTSSDGVTGTIAFTITGSSKACYFCGINVVVDEATQPVANHSLTYDVGSHGSYDGSTTKSFTVAEGGTHAVKTPAEVGISANTGYVFSTWNDGTINYAPSSTYTMGSSDVTLTAQWVAGIALSYNKNNNSATGSTDTTYVASGGTQTVSACGFSLDGYAFSHWNTASDDSGVSYDPDDTISNFTSAVELFAIWEESHYIVVDSIVTSGNMSGGNDANTKFGLSTTDWSIVGTKQSASNLPGFGSDGTTRLYGNANGGNYIVFKTLKSNRSIVKASIEFNGSYSNGATVKQGEGTSGTTVSESQGFYTFAAGTTAFTLINTNSGTTQVRFDTIHIYYEDEAVSTPDITLIDTPSVVGIGTNTASFTVSYSNLTVAFSVSTDTDYVTASYTGATGTDTATVMLSGVAATNSTTITVSSTGAESKSFDVAVEVLPLIDTNLSTMSWGTTTYATSPHTLTWNTSYTWGVSAGQHDGTKGYVGTNSNNKDYSTVDGASWTMTGADYSALNLAMSTADSGSSYWSTYGSAFRMLNFGVLHPTAFSVTAGTVGNANDKYYIFASTDSGSSWTYLTGDSTITAGTAMTWSNSSTYASESSQVQFAFVFTGSTAGKTISDISVKVWCDSYSTTKVLDSIYVSGTPKTTYKVGETFDLNGATVKARYTDSTTYPDEDVTSSVLWTSLEHGTTTVTGSYGGKEVTVNVTVTDEGTVYKKVLSTDELIVGAKVIIGTSNGGYTAGAENNNKNRLPEAAGGSYGYYEDGDIENWSVNTTVFTVGKTETGYTFHDGNGYIYAASSSDNVLRVEAELDENHNAEWSVSITNGVATIVSQGSNTHNTLNGNATAFSAYASPTVAISIYSDVEQTLLNGFGETYLHMTDYTSQSGYCKDDSHHYYITAKAALVAMGSAYIDELQQNDTLNTLQARYEAWARACGDTSPYAGDGIVRSNLLNVLSSSIGNSNTVAIVIVISTISVTAIGGYFFLRKRKEQ